MPVDNGGLVYESEPVVVTPDNPGVELAMLPPVKLEGAVMASVEELPTLVKLPLALIELRLSEKARLVPSIEVALAPVVGGLAPDSGVDAASEVRDDAVTDWLGGVIPDAVLVVGYDPVPAVPVELPRGNGILDDAVKDAVPEEGIAGPVVVASEEPDSVAEEDPIPDTVPVPLAISAVELLWGYGALDDAVSPKVVEREALGEGPVTVEGDPVPVKLLVSPIPIDMELLEGYVAVCELLGEPPEKLVPCPDGYPLVDSPTWEDGTLGLTGIPVLLTKLPVGPVVGSEEFVMGKGVPPLLIGELVTLVFVDDVMEIEPEDRFA
ncbi:hypothetical protein F4802DRAFT_598933 [Xylaria palmicola]|nr:hypothetical protein F4802DRAFT_598933 [Xylaria palmicola]